MFSWTGGATGKVTVVLTSVVQGSMLEGTLTCAFDAAAGQGTASAKLLGMLPKSMMAATSVLTESRSSTSAGGFALDLVVTINALGVGGPAAGSVVLQ